MKMYKIIRTKHMHFQRTEEGHLFKIMIFNDTGKNMYFTMYKKDGTPVLKCIIPKDKEKAIIDIKIENWFNGAMHVIKTRKGRILDQLNF